MADRHPGADALAVGPDSLQPDLEAMGAWRRIIAQDPDLRRVPVLDQEIWISIPVIIPDGQPATIFLVVEPGYG